MKVFYILLFISLLTGCSLWPSKVGYFQDKVEKAPEKTASHTEIQKEAADYLYVKTEETVQAAIKENASTNVLKPAVESHLVANSLSDSLGKPENKYRGEVQVLIDKLDKLEAKFDNKFKDFVDSNNKNAGKEIEGTGLQIGFFTQYIILAVIAGFVWIAIKILGMFNPGVAIGSRLIQGGIFSVGKKAAQLAEETIRGGQEFKKRVESEFDNEQVKAKILELFHTSQKINQSPENQKIINEIIK